jgi:exodeoxyribonuclease VII small subunit
VTTPIEGPANEQLSYERAREELIRIVQKLESGGAPLEESLALWERGEQLARVCQQWLDGARAKIDAVKVGAANLEAAQPQRDEHPSDGLEE